MAVYVSRATVPPKWSDWPYKHWCRLTAAHAEELIEFADRVLGLRRVLCRGGDHPYYLITRGRRFVAMKAGALELDDRQETNCFNETGICVIELSGHCFSSFSTRVLNSLPSLQSDL